MSLDWYRDILEFHARFRPAHPRQYVGAPHFELGKLVRKLVDEEVNRELLPAFDSLVAAEEPADEFMAACAVADGCADAIVVIIGLAQACGVDLRPVWDEVHRANMGKVGGALREDGKILKPEGWKAPDIAAVLERQPPLAYSEPAVSPKEIVASALLRSLEALEKLPEGALGRDERDGHPYTAELRAELQLAGWALGQLREGGTGLPAEPPADHDTTGHGEGK